MPSEDAASGCVLLAGQAADVLIAAVDATARRYAAAEEHSDAPALFSEAGQGMPEVLRRFGVHSGQPELEQRAALDAQRFSDAGCVEDADALTQLEDRLEAAALQRGESFAALEETPATPQHGEGAQSVAVDYLATTLLAIMHPSLRPVESFDVPEGFPVQFPVHAEAELARSAVTAGGLEAEWRVPGRPGAFQAVESFYSDRLQTYRPGGWTSAGGPSSLTLRRGSQEVAGQKQFNIQGYGYQGTVEVKTVDDSGDVTITAVLNQG